MSEEQINLAIAEVRGWKNADHPDVMKFKQGWTMPEKWCMDPKGVLRFNHDRPNYCNDLNAMHEAEKMLLTGSAKPVIHATSRYTEQLCRILRCTDTALFQFAHATARQRAEAFLRTIGKWEEAAK